MIEGSLVAAMNVWAATQDALPLLTSFETQVKASYSLAQPGVPGPKPISQCQHAELSIALFLIKHSAAGGIYEIGVSKSSCYWCNVWLDIANKVLEEKKVQIVVRATHGKRTSGWILPDDKWIAPLFLIKFNDDFQAYYLAALSGRRRSDSKPLSERERNTVRERLKEKISASIDSCAIQP